MRQEANSTYVFSSSFSQQLAHISQQLLVYHTLSPLYLVIVGQASFNPLIGLSSSDYLWHNLRPSSHLFSPELVTLA